jgi:hypothetical protein
MALGRSTNKYKESEGYKEEELLNIRWQLQDARDDLITLLGAITQALRAVDVDNYKLKSTMEIAVLQNGADYLIKKYGVKKFVQ